MASSFSSNSNSNDMISAWNLLFSSLPAMALKCALLLKIPDIIASAGQGDGPDAIPALSISQIAAHMEKPPELDYLSRIMRYLCSIGVFQELTISGESVYGLTRMTHTYFVTQGNPANLAGYHLFLNDEVNQAAWHWLHQSVAEGRNSFHIAHGGRGIWDYANQDARYNQVVNDGMLSLTSVVLKDILEDYDGFKEVTTLVDIGGGVGTALKQIIGVYPHIKAINFDLPHVVANAPHIPGVEHVAGDMFESIPSADAFFLKHVLHAWDDECCIKILKNCYDALPKNGKLILVEGVMDASPQSSQQPQPLQLLDLTMIALGVGGKEKSQQQWVELLGKVGFHATRVVGRKGNLLKIIEAVKVSS